MQETAVFSNNSQSNQINKKDAKDIPPRPNFDLQSERQMARLRPERTLVEQPAPALF
jgi:hypothetical protein